jgi:site-specific DNA recombinase
MPRGAVVYLRVSDPRQGDPRRQDDLNFDRQLAKVRELAERLGVSIVEVFQEQASAFKRSESRPEFQRMLRYLRANKALIEYVLFYSVSRGSRNAALGTQFMEELLTMKMDMRVADMPAATLTTADGKKSLQQAQVDAEHGGAVRRDVALDAWQYAVRRGRWPGTAPWGLVNTGSKTGATLALDKVKGPIMAKGFEFVAQRVPTIPAYRAIKRSAIDAGVRPPSLKQFRKNLTNPLYAGWVYHRALPELVLGQHDALVSKALFVEVQDVLRGRRKSNARPRPGNARYPFRIRCTCGTKLTGNTVKGKYGYYSCKNCGAHHKQKEIEKLIEDLVTAPFNRELLKDRWLDRAASFYSEQVLSTEQRERSLRERRRALEESKLAAVRQSLKTLNPEMQAEYEEEALRLLKQITEIDLQMAKQSSEHDRQQQWLRFAETLFTANMPRIYQFCTPEEREQVRTLLFAGDVFVAPDGQVPNSATPCLYGVLESFVPESEMWRARRDSNSRPTAPEAAALSS